MASFLDTFKPVNVAAEKDELGNVVDNVVNNVVDNTLEAKVE